MIPLLGRIIDGRKNKVINVNDAELWHDFTNDADGSPVTADSGQAWRLTRTRTAAAPVVTSGKYVIADTASGGSAAYLTARLTAPVTFMEADFQFAATGANTPYTDTAAVALIAFNDDLATPTLIDVPAATFHISCVRDRYYFSVITGTNVLVDVHTTIYASLVDNQHFEIAVDQPNACCYVRGADGLITKISHAAIGTLTGCDRACTELFYIAPNTDKRVSVTKTAASAIPINEQSSRPNRAALLRSEYQTSSQFITLDGSETIGGSKTLNNATIVSPQVINPTIFAYDDSVSIIDRTDNTSSVKFNASAISPNTTRTLSIPDKNGTLATLADVPGDATGVTGLGWQPVDSGYINWSFDPMSCYQGIVLTAGAVYVAAVPIRKATTITNVILNVYAAGATLTSGQCFAALYQGGNLLSTTATQHTAWQSTGVKTMALTVPQSVSAGFVYVAFFANGTTKPSISGAITSTLGAVPAFGGTVRGGFDSTNTGRTTSMPATLGTLTASLDAWAAVS